MSLALISGGTLTSGPTKTKVLEGDMVRRHKKTVNISGAGNAVTGSEHEVGRPVWDVNFQGVFNTSGTTYPLAVVNDKLTGSKLFTTRRVVVVKQFPVMDATGAGDTYADSEFVAGRATYAFSGSGWMDHQDALVKEETEGGDNKIGSYVVELYEGGEAVSGAIIINVYRVGLPYRVGGPVPVFWQGVGNTDAPTVTDTPWAIANTGFTGTFAVNTSGATSSFSGTVIPKRIRGDVDYENAMPTVIRVSGVFSGGQ